jgi:NlpC/P60 family putative phage cell wall peptidase
MTMDIIVQEARKWLNTPYHHCGDVLGVGVDCAMFIVRVFCDTGITPPVDPRPYSPDWHLHRSEEKFFGWFRDRAFQVDEPRPGDIPLFRYGRCVSHCGILETLDPEPIMIHASLEAGKVERAEVRRWEDRLVGYWRVR